MPRTPGVHANTLPASGSSAISASVSVSVALVMYRVSISGPPKAHAGAARDRQVDDPVDLAVRVIAHDATVDGLGAPHEPLAVHRETVREPTGLRVELHERTPSADLAAIRIEVEREDGVPETLGVVHDPAVGAPPDPVRTLDLVLHAGDPPIRIESVQGAGRREPVLGSHRAGPESTLTVALAVVESVPDAIRFGVRQDLEIAGFRLIEGEVLAHREHETSLRPRRHGRHPIRQLEGAEAAVDRAEHVDPLPRDVHHIEPLRLGVPQG